MTVWMVIILATLVDLLRDPSSTVLHIAITLNQENSGVVECRRVCFGGIGGLYRYEDAVLANKPIINIHQNVLL
jgi:hypothetical protein